MSITRFGCAALFVGAVLPACTAASGEVNSARPPGAGEIPAGGANNAAGGASAAMAGSAGSGAASASCVSGNVAPLFHRLNRVEYQNSVNALLGTKLTLADSLPVDALVNGFDNNADVSMSATLMQKYFDVAQAAVTAALADAGIRQALIPCTLTDASCPRSVLQSFLPRAFRRPVEAGEVDKYLSYLQVCKSSPVAGMGCALQAALLSSKFLFRAELLATPAAQACTESASLVASSTGKLSGFALASRLSYWLTSAPPDAELSAAAAAGMLEDPALIGAQAERLLSPEVGAKQSLPFIDNFPSQWLQLAAAQSATPSKTLYPSFDDPLRQALGDESRLFFKSVLFGGTPALDLIRTNYTFLNERLASHYGIPGVTGPDMRRVDTTGTLRGGILTQASFLTATSSSENTSIVQRAKWVLTNVLCEHLPAPPPGIQDQVPAPPPALGLTNRESLTYRTMNPPCIGCHRGMNPIGFGLEVFGAIGEPRSMDHGKPVDSSGQLPDGQAFSDTEGLLSLLKQDPRFPVCLTRKVLTYALGHGTEAACDDQAVKALAEQWKPDNYDLKKQIVRIAQSDVFRTARAGQEQAP
jgi:hypothetical protein